MSARAFIFCPRNTFGMSLSGFLERLEFEVVALSNGHAFSLCGNRGCRCGPGQRCADVVIYVIDCASDASFDDIERQVARHCRVGHAAVIATNWSAPGLMRAVSLGLKAFAAPLDLRQLESWLQACKRQIAPERLLMDWFRGAALPRRLSERLAERMQGAD